MNMIATVENIDRSTTAALVTRAHTTKMPTGIEPSEEFAKNALAGYAVNTGTKCGHGCTYCSTGAVLRMHDSFKVAGEKR
jgi:DNA repair photolyase